MGESKRVDGIGAVSVLTFSLCLLISLVVVVLVYSNFKKGTPFSPKVKNEATATDADKNDEEDTEALATKTDSNKTEADITEETTVDKNPESVTTEEVTETPSADPANAYNADGSLAITPNYEDTGFEVPDTELPDVKTVVGKNYFDVTKFEYADSVSDAYFDDAVFIGDSRTEGLELYGGQKNLNAFAYKGMGISKVDSKKVIKVNGAKLTVKQAIAQTKYKYFYISYGINEIGYPNTDYFIKEMNKLIDYILEKNQHAIIYVCSIIPVSKSCSDSSKVFTLAKVKEFNDAQFEMVKERGDCIYLDSAAATADADGYLPEGSSKDGKHPSAKYYKRQMEYIRLHIVKKK